MSRRTVLIILKQFVDGFHNLSKPSTNKYPVLLICEKYKPEKSIPGMQFYAKESNQHHNSIAAARIVPAPLEGKRKKFTVNKDTNRNCIATKLVPHLKGR